MIPQILWVMYTGLLLGTSLAMHGQERKGTYNFNVTLCFVAVELGLLYWGGFFNLFFKAYVWQ